MYYNCLVKFYLSRIRKQHRLKDPSWDLRINIGEDENQNEDRLHSRVFTRGEHSTPTYIMQIQTFILYAI